MRSLGTMELGRFQDTASILVLTRTVRHADMLASVCLRSPHFHAWRMRRCTSLLRLVPPPDCSRQGCRCRGRDASALSRPNRRCDGSTPQLPCGIAADRPTQGLPRPGATLGPGDDRARPPVTACHNTQLPTIPPQANIKPGPINSSCKKKRRYIGLSQRLKSKE
ncbi:hypothetical protein BDY21DRAFT_333252 [Lineolata rhizophorae]|uniref:Uncharacterized protein n=1 Tax=Lineolata rhizophorae TaxID=578093 RepID=A0A6A6P9Z5_9PEZI|nr:hypothetical protein BDY21DRAFT_333252 [Lineolata rhizophorae]